MEVEPGWQQNSDITKQKHAKNLQMRNSLHKFSEKHEEWIHTVMNPAKIHLFCRKTFVCINFVIKTCFYIYFGEENLFLQLFSRKIHLLH